MTSLWKREVSEWANQSLIFRIMGYAFCFLLPLLLSGKILWLEWETWQNEQAKSRQLFERKKNLSTADHRIHHDWEQYGLEISHVGEDMERGGWLLQGKGTPQAWAEVLTLLPETVQLSELKTENKQLLLRLWSPSFPSLHMDAEPKWQWRVPAFFEAENLSNFVVEKDSDQLDRVEEVAEFENREDDHLFEYQGYIVVGKQIEAWVQYQNYLHRIQRGQKLGGYRLIRIEDDYLVWQHQSSGITHQTFLSSEEKQEENNVDEDNEVQSDETDTSKKSSSNQAA